jgi:hypothetical protein
MVVVLFDFRSVRLIPVLPLSSSSGQSREEHPRSTSAKSMSFAALIPDWNSIDSVRHVHSELEAVALVFFALLVLFDVLAHFSKDETRKTVLEKIGLGFFAVAVFAEIIAYPYGQRNDALSGQVIGSLDGKSKQAFENASNALNKSGDAENKSATALTEAKDARLEADSFKKDIVSAKEQAANAESHLAEALRETAAASAELARIKSPRTLVDTPGLVAALKPFSGTEFMFGSVFGDDESIALLSQIDAALASAGWRRIKHPEMNLGIPAIQISGRDDLVDINVSTGVRVEVEVTEKPEELLTRAPQQLPPNVGLAVFLSNKLLSHISPSETPSPDQRANLIRGSSGRIRINVGKKP